MTATKHERKSDEYLFDTRLVERHIAQGRITREQLDKRLAASQDMAEHSETINLEKLTSSAAARRAKG